MQIIQLTGLTLSSSHAHFCEVLHTRTYKQAFKLAVFPLTSIPFLQSSLLSTSVSITTHLHAEEHVSADTQGCLHDDDDWLPGTMHDWSQFLWLLQYNTAEPIRYDFYFIFFL